MKKLIAAVGIAFLLTIPACGSKAGAPQAEQSCSQVFTVGHTLPMTFKGCDGTWLGYGCRVYAIQPGKEWLWAQKGGKVQSGQASMMRFLGKCG